MGQCYNVLMIDDDGTKMVAMPDDWDADVKLMSQAYIGETFPNAIYGAIFNHPMRIGWVGSFANCASEHVLGGIETPIEDFMPLYDYVWGDDCARFVNFAFKNPMEGFALKSSLKCDGKQYYLCNKTKGIYVDLTEYVDDSARWTKHGELCIDPLPLLTAIGNVGHGGDYAPCNRNFADVGTWALDELYTTDEAPADLKKAQYSFGYEEWDDDVDSSQDTDSDIGPSYETLR